jgi:hypothetical protein
MSRRHILVRPEWVCGWCAEPWPCPWARAFMLEDFPDLTRVSEHMSTLMQDAARELPGITAAELWERFLGWLDASRMQQIGDLPVEPPPQPWWRGNDR